MLKRYKVKYLNEKGKTQAIEIVAYDFESCLDFFKDNVGKKEIVYLKQEA